MLNLNKKQPPRRFFKIFVLFFSGATFLHFPIRRTDMNFPGGRSVRRTYIFFSRRVCMFFEQTRIFQKGLSKRPYYSINEQILIFSEKSSNTYEFSRSLYFLIEHIFIFQEALCCPRTHIIIFQESPMPRIIFQEGTPSRQTDISLIGLGGCFQSSHYLFHRMFSRTLFISIAIV